MTFILIALLLLAAFAAQARALRAVQRANGLAPFWSHTRPSCPEEPTP